MDGREDVLTVLLLSGTANYSVVSSINEAVLLVDSVHAMSLTF